MASFQAHTGDSTLQSHGMRALSNLVYMSDEVRLEVGSCTSDLIVTIVQRYYDQPTVFPMVTPATWCSMLAEFLAYTVVLLGDASDRELDLVCPQHTAPDFRGSLSCTGKRCVWRQRNE